MEFDDALLEAIQRADRKGKEAEREKQSAVIAARLAGLSWTAIGASLETSRQAARDRYLNVEQLGKAWKRLEFLLAGIARHRNTPNSTAQMLDKLVAEGSLTSAESADLRLILHRHAQAVDGAHVSLREAELLTDKAVHLSARLFALTDMGVADR